MLTVFYLPFDIIGENNYYIANRLDTESVHYGHLLLNRTFSVCSG